MSRKNRKISKRMSVNTAIATHFGAVIAFLFVMVILNLLANSSCQQLAKTIGDEEKELARLEDARTREETRWLEMQTPKSIERALLANGLKMKSAHATQNVYMRSDGTPYPGQVSIAMAIKRNGAVATAQVGKGR